MFKKAIVLCVTALSVFTYAAEPVGTWSGKIQVDTSKLPADKKALVEAQTGKLKITLQLKKDHTFSSVVTGSDDHKEHSTSGTWTFKGSLVNMIATKTDGKPTPSAPPRFMVLGKDGKTLVMTIQSQLPKGAQLKPGQPAPPNVKVVFKKTA